MDFRGQFRLILHHKLLLRKRQPVILTLEVFWPVLVFLSVFFVKLQFPVTEHPTCYYNARALPSAGVVNLIQSLVCTIDNPCLNSSSYQEVPTFPTARIHNLIKYLSPLINEPNVSDFLYDLPKGMSLAANVLDTLIQPEFNTILETGIPINELMQEIDFEKMMDSDSLSRNGIRRDDVPRVLSSFKSAAQTAVPHVKKLMSNFSKIMNLEQEITDLDVRGSAFDLLASPQTSDMISKVMCGKSLPSLKNELQLLKAAKGLKKPQVNEAELQSISSQFCREGYQQIMQMEGGPIIWSFLKPVFSGKVLFSPDNKHTRSIIGNMNKTVSIMSHFKQTLDAWTQTMSSLQNFYKTSDENSRLQAVQLFIDFLDQHFEGLFKGLEAKKLMEKFDKSGGLLSLMKFVSDVTSCFQLERFVAFQREVDLENAAKVYAKSHELIAGIVFLNLDDEDAPLPTNIEYKLRADIDAVPTTKMVKERMWEPGAKADFFKDLGYQRGFVQIQELLDRAIILNHLNATQVSDLLISPQVHLQQFPYLCYNEDKFALYMRALTPVVATMAWIFFIAFVIRERVLERELHLEEMLRVLGLKPSVAWITWFLIGMVFLAFSSLLGLIVLFSAQMFPHSDFVVVYLYVLAFSWSIIMYCYMISSFFKKATIASLSGIVAYLSSYLPFMVAITLEYDMTFLHKIFTCLSMSTSFCFGMMYLSRFESQGSGVQWSNIWHSPMADDPMNFAWAWIMLLLDGVIYFLIGWYVSNVFPPGCKAQAQPFYFFLTLRYWGYHSASEDKSSVSLIEHLSPGQQSVVNLKPPLDKNVFPDRTWSQHRPGMSIQDLQVVYQRGTPNEHIAVSNLNLELKEGQVSTILGRNGAGKTTTINVLTGQLPPSSGSVLIYGHQVPQDFSRARKLLGYCPQYNTLFSELTVREHLVFYCKLKGLIPEEKCDEEVDSILNSTDLWRVQDEQAKSLSGGLQRRLCVALAFVGGSKLIILDEPTSSVDPVARRGIWDLITQQKQSRTVLLTTHHLDEADILSDQVAVIHRGKLLSNGSPLLLRSKYGCGYQLTVSRQGQTSDSGDSDSGRASNDFPEDTDTASTSSEKLLSFVKCLIPNASLIEEVASEVIIALPYESPSGEPHDYAIFFRCLDANLKSLGFAGYGLTSTTLEDVFISLCNEEEAKHQREEAKNFMQQESMAKKSKKRLSFAAGKANATVSEIKKQFDEAFNNFDWSAPSLETGVKLKLKQFKGLLMKRYLHNRHDLRSVFCHLLLPCFFIALAMAMTLIKPKFAPDPILPLSPRIYGQGVTSFFSLKDNQELQGIAQQLVSSPDRDHWCPKPRNGWEVAKCPVVKGVKRSDEVLLPSFLRNFSGSEWNSLQRDCHCSERCFSREAVSRYSSQISNPNPSGIGFLYNVSQVEVPDFLLNTFTMFNDKRYGGFSFHQRNNSLGVKFDVAKVWFDNNGFHAMVSYLNAFNEALMKANLKEAGINPDNFSISAFSHPLHLRSNQVGDQTLMQRGGDAGIALIILVGFIFIPTSFSFYIVSERIHEEKQLQGIFGVGRFLYWSSALVWDVMTLVVAVVISGVIIFSFQMPIYTSRLNLPAVLLLVFLFGWAMISLVYLTSRFFNEPSIAFMVMYSIALFVGINTMVVRLLIDVFELVQVSPFFKIIFEQVCQVLPPYTLMSGLIDITRNQLFSEIYLLFDHDVYVNPFSMDLLGSHYITLAVEGVVFFVIHLLIELISSWETSCSSRAASNTPVPDEDADVAEERNRVTQDSSRFDVMRVINVSKVVKGMFGKKTAVDRISFAVARGECFGLLGVNGAGKTTLFRMLTGQVKPTSGKTVINRMTVSRLLSDSSQFIGYCPQADALDEVLTPRQHLTIYAELRGVPTIHISRVVVDSLTRFQLVIHADMSVRTLSRGTKRKLCLAIAMLGSPQIVLLDEPTSGMDPMSRRCLWNNIQDAIRDRRSVLLTTHTMEECDILCSRLAIMVNGKFRCIGSPQYLKNKFGAGYVITLRLSEGLSNWNEAIFFMQHNFPSCILRAHHHNMLEFSVPSKDLSLSSVFNNLKDAKEFLQLQDFFVSQTTLDQVFINFAREQNDASDQEKAKLIRTPTTTSVVKKESRKELNRTAKQSAPEKNGSVYSNMAFVTSSNSVNHLSVGSKSSNKAIIATPSLKLYHQHQEAQVMKSSSRHHPLHSRSFIHHPQHNYPMIVHHNHHQPVVTVVRHASRRSSREEYKHNGKSSFIQTSPSSGIDDRHHLHHQDYHRHEINSRSRSNKY